MIVDVNEGGPLDRPSLFVDTGAPFVYWRPARQGHDPIARYVWPGEGGRWWPSRAGARAPSDLRSDPIERYYPLETSLFREDALAWMTRLGILGDFVQRIRDSWTAGGRV